MVCKICREMDVEMVKRGYKLTKRERQAASAMGESRLEPTKKDSVEQVVAHQFLQEVVPVDLADQTAGVVEIGDIGGVL